ncbi:UNVERIFIED_CONTAM: oligopeptide transport system substrate-binding protein [Acetivibrio alkalicellulosi]
MKQRTYYSMMLILLMLAVVLMSGCSSAGAISQEITINLGDEPYTIDPQLVFDVTSMRVVNAIFEGLVRKDKNGQPMEGVAGSWEISDDKLTYTFNLRSDAKWWDGTKVTSNHFKEAWLRAIDPQPENHEPSYMGYLLFYIEGAEEYAYGEGNKEDVAIIAKDEETLLVTLKNPTPYFLDLVSNSVFMPVNTEFYNNQPVENGVTTYGAFAETIMGNGPFKITSWNTSQNITLEKNRSYWNSNNIQLEKVNFKMINDNIAAFTAFKAGEIDVVDITQVMQKDELKKSNYYVGSYDAGVTQYISMNNEDPVLKNTNIRKALAYSLDRKTLIQKIVGNKSQEALGFVSPVVKVEGVTFRDRAGKMFSDNDVDTAKDLLERGLNELGLSSLPKLSLLLDDKETSKRDAQAFQEMWRKNLGVEVELLVMPFDVMADRMMQKNYQLSLLMWSGDFNDPLAYLDIFNSYNFFNVAFYSNDKVDNLLEISIYEKDEVKRIDMLIEAEKIVMDEMPICPVYFLWLDYAVNPRVQNLIRGNSPIQDIDLYWTYIQ